MVVEAQLLAQRPNQQRRLAQVVPWQAGKQVVLYLELQTAMEPIQPCRTAPVHGPIYLHSCGVYDLETVLLHDTPCKLCC